MLLNILKILFEKTYGFSPIIGDFSWKRVTDMSFKFVCLQKKIFHKAFAYASSFINFCEDLLMGKANAWWKFGIAICKFFITAVIFYLTFEFFSLYWEVWSNKASHFTQFKLWHVAGDKARGIDINAKLAENYRQWYVIDSRAENTIRGDVNSGLGKIQFRIIKPKFVGGFGSTDSQLAETAFLKAALKKSVTNAAITTTVPVWLTTVVVACVYVMGR